MKQARIDESNGWFKPSKVFSVLTCAAFILSGCLQEQPGLLASGKTRFAKIAVVPSASDKVLSVYMPAAISDPVRSAGTTGWNPTKLIGQTARSLMSQAGASVVVTTSANTSAAKGSDVVVVLQQAHIDWVGRVYDPGRDFLLAGAGLYALATVSTSESKKLQTYQEWMVLQLRNPEKDPKIVGENSCTVGVKPALLNPATGEVLRDATASIGSEIIPSRLRGQSWAALDRTEKSTVLSVCQVALQKAVSRALAQLDIVQ